MKKKYQDDDPSLVDLVCAISKDCVDNSKGLKTAEKEVAKIGIDLTGWGVKKLIKIIGWSLFIIIVGILILLANI